MWFQFFWQILTFPLILSTNHAWRTSCQANFRTLYLLREILYGYFNLIYCRIDLGGNEIEVLTSVPLTTSSENLDWYFDKSSKILEFKVANIKSTKERKKRHNLGVVDPDVLNQVVTPKIYQLVHKLLKNLTQVL